jgi:hypothetical protein
MTDERKLAGAESLAQMELSQGGAQACQTRVNQNWKKRECDMAYHTRSIALIFVWESAPLQSGNSSNFALYRITPLPGLAFHDATTPPGYCSNKHTK